MYHTWAYGSDCDYRVAVKGSNSVCSRHDVEDPRARVEVPFPRHVKLLKNVFNVIVVVENAYRTLLPCLLPACDVIKATKCARQRI